LAQYTTLKQRQGHITTLSMPEREASTALYTFSVIQKEWFPFDPKYVIREGLLIRGTRERSGADGITITDIISFLLYILTQYFNAILQYNVKYNWSIFCSKSIRLAITIHIALLLFIARGKKLLISVITIPSGLSWFRFPRFNTPL